MLSAVPALAQDRHADALAGELIELETLVSTRSFQLVSPESIRSAILAAVASASGATSLNATPCGSSADKSQDVRTAYQRAIGCAGLAPASSDESRDLFAKIAAKAFVAADDNQAEVIDFDDPDGRYFERDLNRMASVGLTLVSRGDRIEILRTLPNTPARAATIAPGSILVAIDGIAVDGGNMDAAINALNGQANSTVTLTLRSSTGLESEQELVRAELESGAVSFEIEQSGEVLMIRSYAMNQQSAEFIQRALSKLPQGDHISRVVLDLRSNTGGLLDEAIAMTDIFLAEGEIAALEERYKGKLEIAERYKAQKSQQSRWEKLPMTVLIDRETASGAEIIAAALQDQRRATLVGTASFGNHSIQTLFPLSRARPVYIKLTTGAIRRPGSTATSGPIEPNCAVTDLPIQASALVERLRAMNFCP